MQQDSFHRTLDEALAHARTVITCVWCKGENVTSQVNAQGDTYCKCDTCGTRFWLR